MILLLIPVLLIVTLLGYLVYLSSEVPQQPLDPEKVMQAAVDLHRIRRKLDVADLKHRQRRDAAQFKRELAEALEEDDG